MAITRFRTSRRHHRRGAALVEFAVTVPILFAFFVFLWEFSRAEMIHQTVNTAAYEGARQAIVEGGSAADAEQMVQEFLNAVGIRDADVAVTPAVVTASTEEVSVAISVPLSSNTLVTSFFLTGLNINSNITLRR